MFLGHHHHKRSFLPPCSLAFFLSLLLSGSLALSNVAENSGFFSLHDHHSLSDHFRAWKVSLVEYFLELDSLDHIGHCPVALEAARNATHKNTDSPSCALLLHKPLNVTVIY